MKQEKRGGYRENAGRKKGDKETFTIRCKPDNIEKIRCWIKDNNL